MVQNNSVNNKLNLLKGFACICVVFMHISFPGMFGQIVLNASAYAVPVFFMIAGYYAYGKDKSIIRRRLIKIIKIFSCAYILFFSYHSMIATINHEIGVWLDKNFNLMTPIKYICFCTIDFAVPLWYLIAMIEAYICWYFIVKNKKENIALKFIPILFVMQVLLTSYRDTMNIAWFWKTNFITRAMPWFLLGYYMHTEKAERIRNMDSFKLVVLAVSGCIVAIIPVIFDLPVKFNVLGYIPFAFGLFNLCLKNPGHSVCKPIEYIGEKLSLNIYIFHILIAGVIDVISSRILGIPTKSNVWLWCRPVIVLDCTIFASWIVYVVLNIKKLKLNRKISV